MAMSIFNAATSYPATPERQAGLECSAYPVAAEFDSHGVCNSISTFV